MPTNDPHTLGPACDERRLSAWDIRRPANSALSASRSILAVFAVLLCSLPAFASGKGTDGAWVLRIEPPFARDIPEWLPLRIELTVRDGRPREAVASAIHLNQTWYPVEVAGLKMEGGRLTGSLAVAFHADDYEKAVIAATAKEADARRRRTDRFAGKPAQVIAVDVPLGTFAGAAPGTASIETDVLNQRQKPVRTAAHVWRPAPATAGSPRYIEFQLLRWDTASTKSGVFDGMGTGGVLLLRCTLLADGTTRDWICLQGPERYALQTADLIWQVEKARITLAADALEGEFVLAATRDADLRRHIAASSKYANLPEAPLTVRLKARLVGAAIAGSAELGHATPTTSAVLGVLRGQPFARHADRTPRTWAFSAGADPALVAAAEKEAAAPVRPGEPGKRPFWTESALHGGCDIFLLDGKRVVAYDRRSEQRIIIEDYETYRANTVAKSPPAVFSGIAPPTFNLPAVAGAARYRFSAGSVTGEGPVRHAVPAEFWQRLPANGQAQPLTIQALDNAGQALGEAVKLSVARRPAFQGPYFKALPRTCREAALLSARWMRDNPVNTAFRLNHGAGPVWHGNGDGQLWYTTYSGLYAGLALAQASPDPAEREAGLELAITVADVWLRNFAGYYIPDTYKGWVFDQWVYGTAWLDLFRLTGDPRWRNLALELARRLAAKQLPSGTWAETAPETGHVSIDAKTGLPSLISIQGPSMQQWDPSSALYFLGRVRKDLKTDEFRPAEDKAWQWLVENSVARFDWRKQGPHASEDHKQPWLTIPDCALHCYEYLALDLPGRTADPGLMEDLLRWSEERNVDWQRGVHATQVFPRILFLGKNRDTQLRLARAFARQAQRTGIALWRAKAEALAGAMLIAQFPTTGQVPHVPDVDATFRSGPGYCGPGSGDGGNRGEYATQALLDLAALWETRNERKNP